MKNNYLFFIALTFMISFCSVIHAEDITLTEAGTLSSKLSPDDSQSITKLKISGHMDARDFDFIKWNCMSVEDVDLSDVVIDAYTGSYGTNEGYNYTYDADEIPLGALFYWVSSYNHANNSSTSDEGMPSLKTITLPNGITAIRRNAFARAYNLTSINIPEGIKQIDFVAFRFCTSLPEITFPSTLENIESLAFTEVPCLKRIHVKAINPPSISDDSFMGISSDATLYVPTGTVNAYRTSTWGNFFSNIVEEETTTNVNITLTEAGTLSSKVNSNESQSITKLKISGHMDARDFDFIKWNCMSVEDVDLSDVVIDAYTGSYGTNEGYNYTYDADEIPLGALFYWVSSYNHANNSSTSDEGMPSLKTITLPNGITAIRRNAFARAYNLTSINIPEGIKQIDYVAFAVCTSLPEITLPSTLESIGSCAFSNTINLKSIHVKAITPPSIYSNTFEGTPSDATLYVPTGTVNAYRTSTWGNFFSNIVEEGNNTEEEDTEIVEDESNPTINVNDSNDDEIWYTIRIRTSKYLKTSVGNTSVYAVAAPTNLTDDYLWQIQGSASEGYVFINKAYGHSFAIGTISGTQEGDFVKMVNIENAEHFQRSNASNGYYFRPSYNIHNTYLNDCWANGLMGYNLSSDDGSVFHIDRAVYIVEQPTSENPTVIVNDIHGVNYAWYYKPDGETFYDDWQSTNAGNANSTSRNSYEINASKNQRLCLDWSVNSEAGYDKINITINGEQLLSESGQQTGKLTYVFPCSGTFNLTVSYSKDGSIDSGEDMASVTNIYVTEPAVLVDGVNSNTLVGTPLLYSGTYFCVISYTGYDTELMSNEIYLENNIYKLDDATVYENDTEESYSIVEYTRTFSNTKWQALYVPFSMSYDDWKNDFEVAMINDVNMYDTDDDGEYDVTEVEILKLKKGTLKPNTPYFIRAKKAGEKVITLNNATLYPAEKNSIDCSSTQMKFTFTGTYSGVTGNEMYSNGYYALSSGALGKASNSSVSLKSMRWYMSMESRGSLVINPTANVRIRVIGEDMDNDEATGIADITASTAADKVYSLDGRQVNSNNLKAGVYIKNGKKYIVK